MMQEKVRYQRSSKDTALPRRDWILLPIISLSTILVIVVFAETMARQAFSASITSLRSCLVVDAATGVRAIPNSVCWDKNSEGPLVEYKFDCNGYRTGRPCEPKSTGSYRIVLIGSSLAMGQNVPIQKTLGALLPEELSRLVGRQFELYNYAMAFGFPRNTDLRFNDVLAAKPNLILWVLTAIDVKLAGFSYAEFVQSQASSVRPGFLARVKNTIKDKMRELGMDPKSASLTALHYFAQKYMNRSQYIESYLKISDSNEGDWDAGPSALRSELSQEWKSRLKKFEGYAADIARMAETAGVPLVAVMVPNRAQATMISMGDWPRGFDPFRLDQELRSIIVSHGATYIDILPEFRTTPSPERHYYPIDGHPDSDGHALIAGFLAKELSAGAVPALRASDQPQAVLEKGG
jgi:hypothetical protein